MSVMLHIPPLYCPFPSLLAPDIELIQSHLNQWMQDIGYIKSDQALERFNAAKFAWMVGRAYPDASVDKLVTISIWLSWLFILDDLCDEDEIGKHPPRLRALHQSLVNYMRHPRPMTEDDNILLVGLSDSWTRISALSSPEWRERFIISFEDYSLGCQWEAANRVENTVPALDDYLYHRRQTSALYIFFDFIEFAGDFTLPRAVLEDESVMYLKLMANDVCSWFNDILSLEKELQSGDIHNLVIVLQREKQISVQEAINMAAGFFNDRVSAYIELEASVAHFGGAVDADVERYLTGLRYWMKGNIDWSHESGRYGQTSAP